jgi:imidazolonepropionase-like amidohydrolase/Tol biopolymer transport system component
MRNLRCTALLLLTACGGAEPRPFVRPTIPPTPPVVEAPKKPQETPAWDVNNPPGPTEEVAIDVTEGTWMSLDLRPQGDEIVFDLLGDLYTIPISGGDAKPLTSGMAWDMQPCYSPDGESIAFTSDRGAGDNLWVMKRDGTEPRAITKESFRLFNQPAWTPDGKFLAGRKHFTSRRSLGAGEIWLFALDGGDGLQMTKKPNDQKDLGEPAFSPDGRFLYYSQDVTHGDTFEYNKDSNKEIYAIKRLDRETGEIEFTARSACRPTPSPDGRTLAFVRRVRFQSQLWLRDLASGREWAVVDAVERDMQETWAVHGVFPAMAWSRDSKSIVFWSGGKIRRLDIATKQVAEIPFRVKSTRRITPALRFAVDVAPAEFETKMIRWAQVSPKGDAVVFQALGRLYLRAIPEGTPRRLTSSDEFEFFPSWSRDGASIVYVGWDDEKLATIRVVAAAGGEGRAITKEPGHYREPVFSPDGRTIVYRRATGGGIVSPLWSKDPGIYAISEGGEPRRISKEGSQPHFGASNDRVYLLKHRGEKRALVSVALTGAEERTHLTSENATEFRVSPDGATVAFRERFNIHTIPFVPTGLEIEVGPKMASIRPKKLTSDAGDWLHWSDSTRLHWSLGPQLFTGGADKPVTIGFRAPSDVPAGVVAFVNARIVTMRGDEVVEKGVIVVENNRIKAVGSADIPTGAHVVDCTGCTIIPGLVDVHAHGPQGHDEITPRRNHTHYAGLAFGVTTVHDPSNDTSEIFSAAELSRAGLITAPRIFSTGTILYGAAGDFKAEIDSLDDARFHLRRMKAVGAISVKSYNQPRRDQRQQVIAAAREIGMMVVPEGGSLYMHNMTQVVDGHTGIEHSIPVGAVYADTLQLWGRTQVQYTPTLGVGYGGIMGENYWYDRTKVWEDERLLAFVPREAVDARSRRRIAAPDEDYNHFNNARICRQLAAAGVRVNLGAHGQREGLAAHWELWMLAQGGLTPLECLRAGTLHGARYVGLDKDLGSLEPGKLADLVVLEKNPLENIRNTHSVRLVMVNGRLFDAKTMDQAGNHPSKRGSLWWQVAGASGGTAESHGRCGCEQ